VALQDTRDGRILLSLCENFDADLKRLREEMAASQWMIRYAWRGGWCETAPMSLADAQAQALKWINERDAGNWNFGDIEVVPACEREG